MHFAERQWPEASAAYASALAAADALYLAAATDTARQSELEAAPSLVSNAAYSLARQGRFTDAIVLLETGRTRALAEVLARNRAALDQASSSERAAFSAMREKLQSLEAEARTSSSDPTSVLTVGREPGRTFTTISEDLRATRQALSDLAAGIRAHIPDFLPTGPTFATLAATAVDRPLVYLLTTSQGSLALIVPPGVDTLDAAHAAWLEAFRAADQDRLLVERNEQGEAIGGYLVGQVVGNESPMLAAALDRLLLPLQQGLVGPMVERLQALGVDRAIIIPTGRLALLPLHAAAIDTLTVTYAPSARALRVARAMAEERDGQPPLLLAIGNPLPSPQPLAFAEAEVDAIAHLFPLTSRRVLQEERATRAATLGQLPGATHLHFACHGAFDAAEPLESALSLSGGETVTLRDLLDGDLDLSAVRLVVLSACQTGVTDFQRVPDEAVGLPAGFLQAGVQAVVSSLWSIDDLSTALLMERFYRSHLQDHLEAADALRKAQQWLRTATAGELDLARRYEKIYEGSGRRRKDAFQTIRYFRNNPDVMAFAHPYYWAPFVLTGMCAPQRG